MYGSHDEEATYDEWGHHNSAFVTVDFLLPTGIYIPLEVGRNSTIEAVKKELWDAAILYPLFGQLASPDMYVFMYVTGIGTTEEIVTETRRLCEIDILHELPMLKLVKRQGNIEEKRIAQEIKTLAGIKNDDEINKDPEQVYFRRRMREKALQVVHEREKMHWKELLHHHYPPSIVPYLNEHTHFTREFGLVPVKYENIDGMIKKIKVNPRWSSEELTKEALHTWQKAGLSFPTTNPEDYILRGQGCEFIVGDYELYEYKILRDALVKKVNTEEQHTPHSPTLILLHVASVRPILPQSTFGFEQLKLSPLPPPMPGKRKKTISLWDLEIMFSVQVLRTGNLNTKLENKKSLVHIGLFHGISPLCNTCYTKDAKDIKGTEYIWEERCFFDIMTCNLPRNSRLCIAICSTDRVKKSTAKKKADKKDNNNRPILVNATPLCWVNMNLFDFQGLLKSGKFKLPCWGWPDNLDNDNLNPLGVVTTNPDDSAPFVEFVLNEYPSPVSYPSFQDVISEAAQQASKQKVSDVMQTASSSYIKQLEQILNKPSQEELFENDKDLLWFLRLECRDHYPQHLSRILSAVKWNNYKNVAQMQALLNSWGRLEPERAMELLDCQYADEKVREFAVASLRDLRDDQLQQYLLQLVQVIKFESYLDNPLVSFVLDRAWNNRKIGHFLFWHLKSEMSRAAVGSRFSLILEAYLYGNISHIQDLHKQNDALMKMKSLNELVKSPEIPQKDVPTRARQALQTCIKQESYAEALRSVECPLDPSILLEAVETERCKVMNSKMRPLWLVFENQDIPDGKLSVIYKNGDDLRQDMLTLQIISIMDMLWKSEGLDLCMSPYGCLSTGEKTGMIEVVKNSNTIANIQKEGAGRLLAAFRHETLFEWIQQKNQSAKELETAIQNFTYSCAGYCVATYVLGVGDRHSDNIMVTEKGKLVHIDFGHILGNLKKKYGIKRERVPFVLAHDFVHVINKGKTDTKEEFEKFRKICDRAFLILRKKGHLFITLFSLMLSSGLPELTSLDDLNYLRETLALHVSEQQATKLFRGKFNKALKDSWSTSVNWFFHNVAKDNR